MRESKGPAQSGAQGIPYSPEAPATPVRPRNVAIWIDRQTAVLQAFWPGSPESVDAGQTGGAARAVSGGWWAERIQARQQGTQQQYLDAILAHLAPGDEVLILGPDERKQELYQQVDASGGRCGHVVGVCHAAVLTSADVVVPVTHVPRPPSTGASGCEPVPAHQLLAKSREMEVG